MCAEGCRQGICCGFSQYICSHEFRGLSLPLLCSVVRSRLWDTTLGGLSTSFLWSRSDTSLWLGYISTEKKENITRSFTFFILVCFLVCQWWLNILFDYFCFIVIIVSTRISERNKSGLKWRKRSSWGKDRKLCWWGGEGVVWEW